MDEIVKILIEIIASAILSSAISTYITIKVLNKKMKNMNLIIGNKMNASGSGNPKFIEINQKQ